MRDSLDFFLRLLPRDSLGEGNIEAFSLAYGGDGLVSQPMQGGADRLPLRVEDGGLKGNEYASFHGNFDYRITRNEALRYWVARLFLSRDR
jgi:hypothetical protein